MIKCKIAIVFALVFFTFWRYLQSVWAHSSGLPISVLMEWNAHDAGLSLSSWWCDAQSFPCPCPVDYSIRDCYIGLSMPYKYSEAGSYPRLLMMGKGWPCSSLADYLKGTVSRDFLLLVFFMNHEFAASVNDTGGKLPSVSTTLAANLPPVSKGVPTKLLKFFWLKIFFICHRCQRHWWSTLSCEYLHEFSKKFETVLMGYSGAGGKLIDEINQKQKISWHCPFKLALSIPSWQHDAGSYLCLADDLMFGPSVPSWWSDARSCPCLYSRRCEAGSWPCLADDARLGLVHA